MVLPSDDIFRDLVESTQDLVISLDRQGRIFYASPSTLGLFGLRPSACLGHRALAWVHPGDRQQTLAQMGELIRAGRTSATLENRCLDARGGVRHLMWTLNLRYDRQRRLGQINAIGRDITSHKELERELRQSEKMWNTLFMASPTWIILASLEEGNFLDCNHAFLQDTGYGKEEVIGRTTMELGLWSGIKERYRILTLIDTQRRVDKHPLKMRMPDGCLRDFLWSAIIVEVRGRECLLSVLVDVSDLKQAQEQLAQSNRELERRSQELAEMNAALKVLLRQREEDKRDLQAKMWHNIQKMIQPHLFNLGRSGLGPAQKAHLEVAVSRLNQIASNLGRELGHQVRGLTPRELEIAAHVLEGKSNKDMAAILNISIHSVQSHRHAIRKKLGLLGSRDNLRAHLASLAQ